MIINWEILIYRVLEEFLEESYVFKQIINKQLNVKKFTVLAYYFDFFNIYLPSQNKKMTILKKNYTTLLVICNILLLITIFTLFSFCFLSRSESNIVYVDNVTLFNGFNMSKDLGKINNEKITKQKKKLDSLYTIYSIFKEQKNTEKATSLEIQLRSEDQELRKINEYFSNDVSQQVWNRLNQYIKEYGEANEYKIILGTQGNGNIMFAEDGIDITEKILEYANNKYEGN
ncbi:OmpH family outer membrane protein [Aquimarina sp. BL5]|nr:OmpH family outer membrane protein [Aquimarina sp. BL5]